MNVKSIVAAIVLSTLAIAVKAQSIEGTTTNFSTFNASLIIVTNTPVQANNNTNIFLNSVARVKVTNKQLMPLFANWMGITNWPAGAHLAFDWQSYQVVVVDQTGTNVLMYCLDDFKSGIDGITTNIVVHTHKHGHSGVITVTNITYVTNFSDGQFLQVDWFHAPGASAESLNAANPGSDKIQGYDGSFFRLHDNAGNISVTCQGANLQKFSQTWDANGNGIMWKDSESSKFNSYGGQLVSGLPNLTVGGTVTSSGSGKGYNPAMQ